MLLKGWWRMEDVSAIQEVRWPWHEIKEDIEILHYMEETNTIWGQDVWSRKRSWKRDRSLEWKNSQCKWNMEKRTHLCTYQKSINRTSSRDSFRINEKVPERIFHTYITRRFECQNEEREPSYIYHMNIYMKSQMIMNRESSTYPHLILSPAKIFRGDIHKQTWQLCDKKL